ncbi:hypothetical protein BTS2_0089 [Bacillus sp. TS-2]|nr:hypothetical protein BTS2_0089 [Bacillus sp. TS-2]
MIFLAIWTDPIFLIYLFIFSDATGKVRLWPHLILNVFLISASYFIVSAITAGNPFYFLTTILSPFLLLQILFPFCVRFIRRVHSLENDLDIANNKLSYYIKEEERNRIARDLHDTLGHTLTVIKFKSELAIKLLNMNPQQAKNEMKEVLDTARNASKQIREVVTALKHIKIEDELTHSSDLLKDSSITFKIKRFNPIPKLSELEETMITLCIREAIMNSYKHSRAFHLSLIFSLEGPYFVIKIIDDGIGFDVHTPSSGEGLYSIKERMKLIKGKSFIESNNTKGTTIQLQLKLGETAKDG